MGAWPVPTPVFRLAVGGWERRPVTWATAGVIASVRCHTVTCQRSTPSPGPTRPPGPAPRGQVLLRVNSRCDCGTAGRTKRPLRSRRRRGEQHRILLQHRRRCCQVLRSSTTDAVSLLPSAGFVLLLFHLSAFLLRSPEQVGLPWRASERAVGIQECPPTSGAPTGGGWREDEKGEKRRKEGKLLPAGERAAARNICRRGGEAEMEDGRAAV